MPNRKADWGTARPWRKNCAYWGRDILHGFYLGELEREIPRQEVDSMREGNWFSSTSFEEQKKRSVQVEASLQVHEMDIEASKKTVRELGNRVGENNRNSL